MLPRDLTAEVATVLSHVTDLGITPTDQLSLMQVLKEIGRSIDDGKAKEVFKLLTLTNQLDFNLGTSAAVSSGDIASYYLHLLNRFLYNGISVEAIIRLLYCPNYKWSFGAALSGYQYASVMKEYFKFLNQLIEHGADPADVLSTLYTPSSPGVVAKIFYSHTELTHKECCNFLEKMANLGVPSATIQSHFNAVSNSKTYNNIIQFFEKEPARLYRFLIKDMLPDRYFPSLKHLKYKVWDEITTQSRDKLLDACLQIHTKDTSLNKLANTKRYWWWRNPRPNAGLFLKAKEKATLILEEMEKEELSHPLTRISQPQFILIPATVTPPFNPAVQPPQSSTAAIYSVTNSFAEGVYPQKVKGEWLPPNPVALNALETMPIPVPIEPPPSFNCVDEPQIKEGVLIDFNAKSATPQKSNEQLLADLMTQEKYAVPKTDPNSLFATKSDRPETKNVITTKKACLG